MPRMGFAIDNRSCIGCHACTVACKSEHSVPIGVNRTWVKYVEQGTFPDTKRSFSVQRCNHCDDAPCVEICPVTSLYRRPDGIVDFDSDRCIGCTACMQACPYDAIYLDPATLTAAKCNYCTHRVDAGYEPACVIVCPVEAIVCGDLDDPDSKIAKLQRTQQVHFPKVEKRTEPKLFYVGGETANYDPTSAPPAEQYLWSAGQAAAALDLIAPDPAHETGAGARRVYDAKAKPTTWGWMVSAYITTKAIATGTAMMACLLFAAGRHPSVLPRSAAAISLVFLAVTGALLVGDLKQPRRFLYILLRPQWKSWLVRGAYLISAFGLVLGVCAFAPIETWRRPIQSTVGAVLFVLAASTASYTALLFAQAKGRDYWQNRLFVITMFVDALVAGAAVLTLVGAIGIDGGMAATDARMVLGIAVTVLAALLIAEFAPSHATKDAALAARLILHERYRYWFWGGVVSVGILVPAVCVVIGVALEGAAMGLIVGIAAKNHVFVQAPQRIPLS
ncbi:MAG: polysulfide reductase NrfD [Planctomycetes bacterium]|nr:polysulfide reductase NrfD [Planctomycetota bacterium]